MTAPTSDSKRRHPGRSSSKAEYGKAKYGFLVVAASGCVLFVNPKDYGAHCSFQGAKTPCGSCLTANCITEVDACCLGDTCGSVITDVEDCATRSDEHCKALQSLTDEGGVHRDLSACVMSHCQDACAASDTRCMPAYSYSVNACSCRSDETPNGTPCTSDGKKTLRCCAPDGWPGPTLECDCLSIICVPLGDECLCELSPMDNQDRATECPGGNGIHCCAAQGGVSCNCSPAPCLPTDNEVGSCGIAQLKCDTGEHQVDACSERSP
jgi:hypothetical protein